MERLNALVEGLTHVARLLAEDVLEPDASRTDWAGLTVRVDMARQGLDKALAALEGALEEAEDEDSKALVRQRAAEVTGRTAALLLATGDTEGGRALLERALRIAEAPEQRAKLEAGLRDPAHFGLYEHAMWAWGRGRTQVVRERLRRVATKAREKTLQELARTGLHGSEPRATPRPIDKSPPLLWVNGCGTGLYGKRDEAPDGTYVATYCIILLFIPVFPLTAYRVRRTEGPAWQFLSRESLGPLARVWQGLVLLGLAGALVWAGVNLYQRSPGQVAQRALDEVRTAEATLSPEEALRRYQAILDAHEDGPVRAQAAEAVMRLSIAKLPSPCTRDSGDAVEALLSKLTHLPRDTRPGSARELLARRLEACAGEMGQGSLDELQAALAVVQQARDVAGGHPMLRARQAALTLALADLLVKERPLRALALYTELPDERARDAARALLDSFGEAPSLWLEAEHTVKAWLAREDVRSTSPEAQRYRKQLEQARATHEKDMALIAEGDEEKLVQALEATPANQELAVAVAHLRLARGEAAEAVTLLEALGPQGRLTGDAQVLLASCHRARGALEEADAVLSAFVSERLAPFQRARREYEQQAEAVRDEFWSRVDKAQLPRELEQRLQTAAGEEEQRQLRREWLSKQVEQDPRLEKLRAAYLRHQHVVPASLQLGLVKMQRANRESTEARAARLGEAERVFLSIRREAENDPRFHLALGQVYHWLDRALDGDMELISLVKRNEPELTLEVAEVYRELGREEQARSLISRVYITAGDEQVKYEAASDMARLADDDEEREAWLLKSDQTSPGVQDDLLELRANRAANEGRLEEADGLLAQYVARNLRDAKHEAATANNIALAMMRRFKLTGHPEHLHSAVEQLESAVRLAPDNAVMVGNLADAREYLGHVSVLERWVRTQVLRPTRWDAERLVDVLLEGPLRAELLRALDADPSLRRGQELAEQEQILAPDKVEAWERRLRWLKLHRDTRGLEALERRLESLMPFDEEYLDELAHDEDAQDEEAPPRESSPEDERPDSEWTAEKAALARAEQTNHAPTIAVAWHLLGDARRGRYLEGWTPGQLDTMVEAYRQAAGRWPALGVGGDLDDALTRAAVQRGAAKSEALAKVWKKKRWTLSTASLVHQALTGPEGEQVARVLREQPELREAVARARRRAPSNPLMADWVLAKAAGDVVLERAAAALFTRPDAELSLTLDVRLSEGSTRPWAARELFLRARAGGTAP